MKKLLALLLALMLVFSLAACDTHDDKKSAHNGKSSSKSNSESLEDTVKIDKDVSDFEEVVVADNSECTITITGVEPDNMFGFTLNAQLVNKSADITYTFSIEEATINNVECDPVFIADVAPEKQANEDISFDTTILEENGIKDFTDIMLKFKVYDSENLGADNVAEETVHIYPYGESNAKSFKRKTQKGDNVIVDTKDITVTVTGYEHDDIWGYCANLYIENKSDRTLMVSVEDASVNGYMEDPFFASTVSPGASSFEIVAWSDEVLEENEISEVEEIQMTITVNDYDNYITDGLVNEEVTLNP